MPRDIKICILSELAYSFLKGEGIRGGAELQMTTLAKELVKKSYDVSFVTFLKSRDSPETVDDIKVYNPFYNKNSGYTYLYPQNMYKLLKILNKINADIYIQRAITPLTGIIAFFAKLKSKAFLYSVSSNKDVSDHLLIKSVVDLKKLFYRFGVKYSQLIICQTNDQKNLLEQRLGKEGVIIKNFYIPEQAEFNQRNSSNLKVLWVGRILREKRPELFLRLAKKNPKFKFGMIGFPSSTDPNLYYKIKEAAECINNLEFIGFVPHDEIGRYYAESSLFISTSSNEGFPNTFIEAWGHYTPVVSLGFDPDEIICKNKLGLHSETFEQMIEHTKMLLKDEKLRVQMGLNSRRYVEREHNIKKIINEYEQIFDSLNTQIE